MDNKTAAISRQVDTRSFISGDVSWINFDAGGGSGTVWRVQSTGHEWYRAHASVSGRHLPQVTRYSCRLQQGARSM